MKIRPQPFVPTKREMKLYKGISQVQKWIEEGDVIKASNACTDLLITGGGSILYDKEIIKLYENK